MTDLGAVPGSAGRPCRIPRTLRSPCQRCPARHLSDDAALDYIKTIHAESVGGLETCVGHTLAHYAARRVSCARHCSGVALAGSSPELGESLPQVQTLAEAGVTGFEGYNWFGLPAPAGTPAAIVRKIADDVREIQRGKELHRRFVEEMFVEPTGTTPEEFSQILAKDLRTWTSVIRRVGVTLE